MEDRYLFRAKRTDSGEWVEGNLITNVFFRLGHSTTYKNAVRFGLVIPNKQPITFYFEKAGEADGN